jgi:alkaline phosphatase D
MSAAFDPRRRAFLNFWAAGAAAAGFAAPFRGDARAQTPRWVNDPFSLGVASGDPTADGFVLWTRLAPEPLDPEYKIDGPVEVQVEIAEDEAFKVIARRETVIARPDFAHAVHAEIEGLRPGRPYFYRFRAGGVASPVGRASTAPVFGAPLAKLRFGWHSCSHYEQGYFTAYRDLAAQNPDVVLSLGDYIYEVSWGPQVRRQPVNDALTLDDFRLLHAGNKLDKDLQALHAACPWLFIWDDHEVANDYQGDFGKMLTREQGAEGFVQRRIAAYRAFYEHTPLRLRSRLDPINRMRLWGECGYGDLIDFTLLDTRQYRARHACLPQGNFEASLVQIDACPELADPNRSILGREQERFFDSQFMRAPFTWSVLVQPTLFGGLNQKDAQGRAVAFTDGWGGFPAARQRIVDTIARRQKDSTCVVIGGDMHGFWTTEIKQDFTKPESPTVAVEFVPSSITTHSYMFDRFTRMLPDNPHIKFFDDRTRGYGLADVTQKTMTVSLRTTPTVWRKDAPFSTLKRYVVEAGAPRLQEG